MGQTQGFNLISSFLTKGTIYSMQSMIVMFCVFVTSAVDRGFGPGRVMPKDIQLVCAASSLST